MDSEETDIEIIDEIQMPEETRGHKNSRLDLTAEYVRQIFEYNPITGILIWKIKPAKYINPGTKAGNIDSRGHMTVRIRGKGYLIHRIAWLYMTGSWPDQEIDHIDRNRANNSWANLREATSTQNQYNSSKHKDNTTGFKGVCYHKRDRKYTAQIMKSGKLLHLGYFNTPEEASKAYNEASKQLHGVFGHGSDV
jgi:hypothetical protein